MYGKTAVRVRRCFREICSTTSLTEGIPHAQAVKQVLNEYVNRITFDPTAKEATRHAQNIVHLLIDTEIFPRDRMVY